MAHLEHIGIAVDEVRQVVRRLDALLGLHPYKAETVEEQQVRTHFLDAGTAKLELLESLDPDSPVQRFLDRRGEGLHHLAFEVSDLEATLHRLRAAGVSLLQDTPQPGADDKRIAFVHPKETHGVLVEFCETGAPDWSPRWIEHSDRHLAVYERGDPARPTLLLLHGPAGSTAQDTAGLMRHLESHFHGVGLDLSGHGASALPTDGRLTIERFVADVGATLDVLDGGPVHLFGLSLGATVALRFALQSPDRVDRLTLAAPNLDGSPEQVSALRARLDPDRRWEEDPERADGLRAAHDDFDALLPALRSFVDRLPSESEAVRARLSEVHAPTLAVGFDEDPVAPVTSVRSIHDALPSARLALLPGTGLPRSADRLSLLASLLRDHLTA